MQALLHIIDMKLALCVPIKEASAMNLSTDELTGQLTTWDAVTEFLYAGNATFTLVSLKTGGRFTYRVRVKKEDVEAKVLNPTYFVSLLRGADNTSDYAYMGVLRRPAAFNFTAASKVLRTAPSATGLLWFLDKMLHRRDVLGSQVQVWHEGKCGRCGRKLTVPDSIERGLGPECAGLMEAA